MIHGVGWLPGWWLPFSIAWPLLLALAYAFPHARRVAATLGSLAAIPALAVALLARDGWSFFDWAYTGLSLDDTGRAFLLLVSILWLVAARFTIPGPREGTGALRAVLAMMAMSGLFGTALAEDAVVLISASTLAGYALAGLLACGSHPAAVGRTRLLVGLLVIGDLLLLEALLMLAHGAPNIELSSLRAAFANDDQRGLILAFLLIGLGVKVGLAGLHVWLPPQLPLACAGERLAVLAFTLGIGLLGWLRLLPLGEASWPAAAQFLSWGAWIIPAYALVTGVLQPRPAGVLAYAMIGSVGLWMALFSLALGNPQHHNAIIDGMIDAVGPIALAMAACLLIETGAGVASVGRRLAITAMAVTCGLVIALSIGMLAARPDLPGGQISMVLHWGGLAVVSLMLVAGLRRPVTHGAGRYTRSRSSWSAAILLVAIALLSTVPELLPPALPVLTSAVMLLSGASLIALIGKWLAPVRFHAVGTAGVWVPLRPVLASIRTAGHRLTETHAIAWSPHTRQHWNRIADGTYWVRRLSHIQSFMNRWPTAAMIALLLGLIAAALGRPT